MVYHLKWAWPNQERFWGRGSIREVHSHWSGRKQPWMVRTAHRSHAVKTESSRGRLRASKKTGPQSYSCKEMDSANNQWAWKRLPSVRWESQPWPPPWLHPGEPPSKWPCSVGPRILMYRNWEIIRGCSKLLNMWYSVTLNRKCIYQLPSLFLYISMEEESHTLHIQKELWISFHPPTLSSLP